MWQRIQNSLNAQIMLASLAGLLCGLLLKQVDMVPFIDQAQIIYVLTLLGSIFIGALKIILVPLIFCSIVVGVSNLQLGTQMHRVWKITLLCFMGTTSCALLLGLAASHLFQPGQGLTITMFNEVIQSYQAPDTQLNAQSFISNFIQNTLINPFQALASGNILAIVIFAMLIGAALVSGGERFQAIKTGMQQSLDLIMLLVQWIMRIAPIGIFALLTKLIATEDFSVLERVGEFAIMVTGTTLFHGLIILPLLLWFFGRMSPWQFFPKARASLVTAFATSSSAITMPVTLKCTEQLGVKPEVSGFVVPLGTQMNMDGTALYEAAAALFIAQLIGLDLSLGQQVIICMTAMLASVGAPGIPSAGMVTMIMVLQAAQLPVEAIAILLPMDRLLDTVRTVVNVQGDMTTSVIVQRYLDKADIA